MLDVYFLWTANLGTHTFFMIFLPLLFWFGYPQLGRRYVSCKLLSDLLFLLTKLGLFSLVAVMAFGVFWSGFIKVRTGKSKWTNKMISAILIIPDPNRILCVYPDHYHRQFIVSPCLPQLHWNTDFLQPIPLILYPLPYSWWPGFRSMYHQMTPSGCQGLLHSVSMPSALCSEESIVACTVSPVSITVVAFIFSQLKES